MEVSFIRHSHQTLDGSLYRWFTNYDKGTRKSTLKCKLLQIECIPLLHVPYVHTEMRYLSILKYNTIYRLHIRHLPSCRRGRKQCPLQLEEMAHMSQALWMSGSSAESPPRFVDMSLAPSPLLVWRYPLSGNDGAFCLPSKGLLYFLLLLNGSQQLSCKTSECH